jgi:drug/metabolite transporter (DMT)-like permease
LQVGSVQKAAFYVFLGMLCISINDLIVKQFSTNYPLHEIIFIRSTIAMLLTLFLVKVEGGVKILKTNKIQLHALRAISIFLCNMIFFFSNSNTALSYSHSTFLCSANFYYAVINSAAWRKSGNKTPVSSYFWIFWRFYNDEAKYLVWI